MSITEPVPVEPAQPDTVKALVLASRAFVGVAARSFAVVDPDVTLPQFRVLVVLVARGPQRSSDIADELQVNPSTATRMLDRLIRKGLVRRSRSASDRRAVQVRATAEGRQIVEQTMAHRRAELQRIVENTCGLWQPAVVTALTTFAEAAGENDDQQWWLGWNEQYSDAPTGAER
ncbi:MarR family transcriptional regulator [Actinoplanes sp. KI2]|uniref:MarR family winged helix-turn-helix transcriptional regulator n=1 Tax=Actinoplanes sp. KI2 TaxID=2983315 RepID=UPI0021D5816F|nr:MarR family transcriptional regulator [Actinoplanes sp. KI2]MCU7730275.1 MarR family transcriptional regulator [Actinoplanes sp. KI2]